MDKNQDTTPPWSDPRVRGRKKFYRVLVHILVWIGIAALYYIAFSFFFDTPVEFDMKRQTAKLKSEYKVLNERYDSLADVLTNVEERDKSVFNMLFESNPYNLDTDFDESKWRLHERLMTKSNRGLAEELGSRTKELLKIKDEIDLSYREIVAKAELIGDSINFIPSIQPIVNKELTLLTASFGLRMHPFYKTLTQHSGVDYTVPEGTRVFATANGVVKNIVSKSASSGLSIVIGHNEEYETTYSHLSKINVKKGQKVKRGDIIAWTGNSGLSLSPHLHYEIKHLDMRIDPIHYFFMELTPVEYRKMMNIAKSGMQSFD